MISKIPDVRGTARLPLVGLHEIHMRYGLDHKQKTVRLTNQWGFPDPVETLECGKVWSLPDIEEYDAKVAAGLI